MRTNGGKEGASCVFRPRPTAVERTLQLLGDRMGGRSLATEKSQEVLSQAYL